MAESASSPVALLDRHLEAFNHGVRTGDFARMLAMFETDAVFELAAPVSVTHEGLGAIRTRIGIIHSMTRCVWVSRAGRTHGSAHRNSRIAGLKLTDGRIGGGDRRVTRETGVVTT
jgi:hypothetical protein